MNAEQRGDLKRELALRIGQAQEVCRIVVFGSFLTSDYPEDMDVAVFQDSQGSYLPLAMKYRRLARSVAERIPLDIIPLRPGASGPFIEEICRGEAIYER